MLISTLPKMTSDLMKRENLDPETEIWGEHQGTTVSSSSSPTGFRRRVALLTPRPPPSSSQDCETTFCCLSQSVCGTLFQQPQKTNIEGILQAISSNFLFHTDLPLDVDQCSLQPP